MEETKKVERIPGTHYVKVGDSIFNTIPKDTEPKKVVCLCLYCGEKFGGNAAGQCAVYCKNCKTIENRKKMTAENKVIDEENKKKGYV
jgi:hypothetical protein